MWNILPKYKHKNLKVWWLKKKGISHSYCKIIYFIFFWFCFLCFCKLQYMAHSSVYIHKHFVVRYSRTWYKHIPGNKSSYKAWNIDYTKKKKHSFCQKFENLAYNLPLWAPPIDHIIKPWQSTDLVNGDTKTLKTQTNLRNSSSLVFGSSLFIVSASWVWDKK